ncbi:MAG: hypothetical protein V7618_08600, partial [Rhodoglobus sp.]
MNRVCPQLSRIGPILGGFAHDLPTFHERFGDLAMLAKTHSLSSVLSVADFAIVPTGPEAWCTPP